jgi:hypothetical protein
MPTPSYRRPNDPTHVPVSRYLVIGVGAIVVAAGFFVVLSGGDGGRTDRAAEVLNARGDSLLSALRASRAEGDFAGALAAAEELASGSAFAGTAWADSGSALLQPLRDTLAVEEVLGVSRSKWAYNRSTDLETSINVYHAMIESENLVNLAAPYDGEQRGALYFRTHPRYGRQIYLQLERGSLVCPTIGGCTVGVQFDDEPQVQWEATRVGDLSPQMIFLDDHDAFIQRVMDAGTLRIQPTAFPDERPVFEFEVSGFEYDLYSTEPLS